MKRYEKSKKLFMIQEIINLIQKKIIISQQKLVMLLVVTILSMKVMEINKKQNQLKIILMKLNHILVTYSEDHTLILLKA